ncbi:alginate export family protein [Limibacter armeniacum]|uniref:alginate export family protein n=1 Tax=Limibacter armeniacum TaxID=466084 RepID=UPI002FE4FE97
MKKFTLTICCLCCTLYANAQFTLEGQYRPRAEVRNGFKAPILTDTEVAAFVEHRARITAGYSQSKLGFKLSVQDVRIWGETGQINKADNLLSIHEAYGEYKPSKNSTFRIGRQEVAIDGHRFFGTLDWAAQARAFDAVRYLYKDSIGNEFQLMGTFNQNGLTDSSSPEPAKNTGNFYNSGAYAGANTYTGFGLPLPKAQVMGYVKKMFGTANISFMGLVDFMQPTEGHPYPLYHFGISPNYKLDKLNLSGQLYYSTGTQKLSATNPELEDNKLSAYMLSLSLQHTGLKGKPLLGVDYISGDDKGTTDVTEGWAPLYGTNHKFYGFMDYFYVGSGHNGGGNNKSGGLVDIYLKTTFKVGESSNLLAHLHAFSSPTDVYDLSSADPEATLGSYLGTELDLVFVKKLAENITFKAGYSQMFGTTSMQQVKGQFNTDTGKYANIKGMQNWTWVMINFTPKFL